MPPVIDSGAARPQRRQPNDGESKLMPFRERGQSDIRRRRMLLGNQSGEPSPATGNGHEFVRSANRRRYDIRGSREQQIHLTQLIPQRAYLHVLFWILGTVLAAATIATCLPAFHDSHQLATFTQVQLNGTTAFFDWLLNIGSLAAGSACLVIYLVRRHRLDDYRGRYRLWLWAACSCFVASYDSVTHTSLNLAQRLESTLAPSISAASSLAVAWPLIFGLVIAMGLYWEVRESKWVRLAFVIAFCSGTVNILLTTGTLQLENMPAHELASLLTRLSALWWFVTALSLYARLVNRHANAAAMVPTTARSSVDHEPHTAPQPNRNDRDRQQTPSRGPPTRHASSDRPPTHVQKTPISKQSRASATDAESGFDEADESEFRTLSKSERRRLKKLKRKRRRQKAA